MNGTETAQHAVRHGLRDAHHEHRKAREKVLEEVALRLVSAHDADEW